MPLMIRELTSNWLEPFFAHQHSIRQYNSFASRLDFCVYGPLNYLDYTGIYPHI